MNSIHEKEKKLEEALEKLNLINPHNLNLKETISNLDQQKNQLQIEKKELEIKYREALLDSVKNFWSTATQKKLKLQREKINDTYSWDVRSVEWKNFFDAVRVSKR